jgi:hypothetical protein
MTPAQIQFELAKGLICSHCTGDFALGAGHRRIAISLVAGTNPAEKPQPLSSAVGPGLREVRLTRQANAGRRGGVAGFDR